MKIGSILRVQPENDSFLKKLLGLLRGTPDSDFRHHFLVPPALAEGTFPGRVSSLIYVASWGLQGNLERIPLTT